MTDSTQNFLFELGCEELPPTALKKFKQELEKSVIADLEQKELTYDSLQVFASPRRLGVLIRSLSSHQPDRVIEKLGPAVVAAFDDEGNAKPAALGFAKSCGVDISELEQIETPKGLRLGIQQKQSGDSAKSILPEVIKNALSRLPVPKMMRWGRGDVQFTRPAHWLVMLLGNEVIDCNILGLNSGRVTRGHRFYSEGDIKISSPEAYESELEAAHVISDFDKRRELIQTAIKNEAEKLGANTEFDQDLLDEVCSLVEWPVAMVGSFEDDFLSVPQEALVSTMAKNQKYFHLLDQQGELLPKFIFIANIDSSNPETVISGNERVIRPRLADAKFFFDKDSKHSLTSRSESLKKITFQHELGSIFDKTTRIADLANYLSEDLNLEALSLDKAASICKSDLTTDMVGEFPSLQGIMGRYYAEVDGESTEVCQAMDEIYMPRFSGDKLPSSNTGLLLALADRIDTLCSIFAIGQIPTGNKDPFALRRATLGILRILIEHRLNHDLNQSVVRSLESVKDCDIKKPNVSAEQDVIEFINARMKALFLEQGYAATEIAAVLSVGDLNPYDIALRLEAIKHFNAKSVSQNLAAANKRVANILAKLDEPVVDPAVDPSLLEEPAEINLHEQLTSMKAKVDELISAQDYQSALDLMAELQTTVDQFFDDVMVMAEDPLIKENRINLLANLRALFMNIADISSLQK